MGTKTNMACPFAYLLVAFMWVVRNGGKIFPRALIKQFTKA
jgi:hypothetical protein